MADLDGKKFRAVRRLSDKDNRTLANVGESCERVPARSLPALLASGKIVPLTRRRRDEASTDEEPS